jgi:hypothetical protein
MHKKEVIEKIFKGILNRMPVDWAKKVFISDFKSSTYKGKTIYEISIEFVVDDKSEMLNINNITRSDFIKRKYIEDFLNKIGRIIPEEVYVNSNSISSESYYNNNKNGR